MNYLPKSCCFLFRPTNYCVIVGHETVNTYKRLGNTNAILEGSRYLILFDYTQLMFITITWSDSYKQSCYIWTKMSCKLMLGMFRNYADCMYTL